MDVPAPYQEYVGLRFRNPCNWTECEPYHVCINETECVPCEDFCVEDSSTYERRVCRTECQDYLHDFVYQYMKRSQIDEILSNIYKMQLEVTFLTFMAAVVVVLAFGLLVYLIYRKQMLKMIGNRRQTLSQVENENDEPSSISMAAETNLFYTQSDPEMAYSDSNDSSSVWGEVSDSSVFVLSENDKVMLIPSPVAPKTNVAETKL